MDIEVTSKTSKTARQYKLSPEELAFADLLAVGWEPEDAWTVAIRKGVTWTKKARKDAIGQLAVEPAVKERITDVQAVLRKSQIEAVKKTTNNERQDLISSAMSKEQMLLDLQEAIMMLPTGSKEWIDLKKLVVDVTRMKQDEIKEEDNTVHYYLPVDYPESCEYCLRSKCDQCRYKKEAEK